MTAFTTAEKLAQIEGLIINHRWARADPMVPENRTYEVLKTIAADLRGRLDSAPGEAEHALERRIVAIRMARSRRAPTNGALVGLAEELIGRWPVVRQALVRFGAMAEEER